MRLRVTVSRCILQLSAGAWTSLRTFPYLFLRLYLVFISVCSSSLTRPVYRICMYSTPTLTINLFAASISYVLQKKKCFCHELIKKDLSRGYHPKTAIENKKLAKTSEGYRSFFYTPLQPYISRFPPPPRRLAQENAIPFSCSVMSPILDRTRECLCFPCHRLLSVSKRGWRWRKRPRPSIQGISDMLMPPCPAGPRLECL